MENSEKDLHRHTNEHGKMTVMKTPSVIFILRLRKCMVKTTSLKKKLEPGVDQLYSACLK